MDIVKRRFLSGLVPKSLKAAMVQLCFAYCYVDGTKRMQFLIKNFQMHQFNAICRKCTFLGIFFVLI
ncbi:Hypothetical protein HEAR0946 [Herminiimonas arsenicoxydans]|uniref:Uncharacterized protein n=1 Tax=Herminiimonas arsenicoxydans TaxID=204773 RepID=A4G3P2_HERAR|nr:Hypothetical protein HEAR0946 [Herminiimonas arsenicoxydans]